MEFTLIPFPPRRQAMCGRCSRYSFPVSANCIYGQTGPAQGRKKWQIRRGQQSGITGQ